VSVQVRNFGVSRAFSANADASNPGVVTIGTNIDVAGGVISVKTGTTSDKGVLSVGSNLAVTAGAVSVPDATTGVKGVVSVGTNLAVASGAISVETATTAVKGVMQVGSGLTVASGVVSVNGASNGSTALEFANGGLKVRDTNNSHSLVITPGSDLSSDRVLTVTTGDAARTVTLSGNLSVTASNATVGGTNTGDQTITLTGDVTGTGTGSFATTIAASAVTVAKMANLAADTILGNATGAAAAPTAITCTAAGRALLDDANAATQLVTLGADAKYAQLSGGANAAFTNPPTLATAVTAFSGATEIVNKGFVESFTRIGSYDILYDFAGRTAVSPYNGVVVYTIASSGVTITTTGTGNGFSCNVKCSSGSYKAVFQFGGDYHVLLTTTNTLITRGSGAISFGSLLTLLRVS
jgi:hypothetical protein